MLTYDLRGHGYSDTPPSGYSPDSMAEDLLELLDTLEIERPWSSATATAPTSRCTSRCSHPRRVREVIAIEAALPALEQSRRHDGLGGLVATGRGRWSRPATSVPAEQRSDLRYMIRATIDLPKQWGPLKGLPRNPKPLLRLLDETTLPEEYRQVGTPDARRDSHDRRRRSC